MRGREKQRMSAGFTLLELLVVIAVIAILASLILPTLARTKQAADSIACKNNVRQIALGLVMYTSDFGYFPPAASAAGVLWVDAIEPYTKSKWPIEGLDREGTAATRRNVYICPGYSRIPGAYTKGSAPSTLCGSYALNVGGVGSTETPLGLWQTAIEGKTVPLKEGAVLNPADMVALGDSVLVKYSRDNAWRGSHALDEGIRFTGNTVLRAGSVVKDRPYARRHATKWNIAFCDGHVEGLKATEIFDFRKPQILRRWNRDNLPHQELLPPAIYYE
jgi:prepilin-type N-terminal cleavage/methylation domain-containing protein/prepilin-type processing-associated H-X9-DG protein